MTTRDHVNDLLAAYALDSLDDEEMAEVAEHLAICEHCRTELASVRSVVDQLGLTVHTTIPPVQLKDSIMSSLQARPRSTPPQGERWGWWQRLTAPLVKAAPALMLLAILLIGALGTGTVLLWRKVDRLESLSLSREFQIIGLSGTTVAPHAKGQILISRDGRLGILVVVGLPTLDEGHKYQLWLIRDGQRTNGGLFSVIGDGYGSMKVAPPDPLTSYTSYGVTIEPAGGSPQPTGKKVLGVSF